jgi:RHS repeat-associated protein
MKYHEQSAAGSRGAWPADHEPGLEELDASSGKSDRRTASRSVIRYYHTDKSGIPYEVTGSDGRSQWRAEYRAWGARKSTSLDTVDPRENSGDDAIHQPLRFQGQYLDHQTGLHYNNQRYYDPDSGRFLTQDPIGLAGGINLYRYAPNPGRWVDPLGLAVDLSLVGQSYACNLDMFPTTYQVLGHGAKDGWLGDGTGNVISPQGMSGYIQSQPDYRKGQAVTLYACHMGSGGDKSYAQQLSNELGADVIAPTDRLDTCNLGGGDVLAKVANGGTFARFIPIKP